MLCESRGKIKDGITPVEERRGGYSTKTASLMLSNKLAGPACRYLLHPRYPELGAPAARARSANKATQRGPVRQTEKQCS